MPRRRGTRRQQRHDVQSAANQPLQPRYRCTDSGRSQQSQSCTRQARHCSLPPFATQRVRCIALGPAANEQPALRMTQIVACAFDWSCPFPLGLRADVSGGEPTHSRPKVDAEHENFVPSPPGGFTPCQNDRVKPPTFCDCRYTKIHTPGESTSKKDGTRLPDAW